MAPTETLLTSGVVSDRLGVPRWQLLYLIERGALPGPRQPASARRRSPLRRRAAEGGGFIAGCSERGRRSGTAQGHVRQPLRRVTARATSAPRRRPAPAARPRWPSPAP